MTKLFGTDGVRGRWGQAPLTVPLVRALGASIRKHLGPGPVLLARDTRASGPELRDALLMGLGGDAVDLGVLPTPAVSVLLQQGQGVGGLVLTASHNPWHDNGIKVVAADGRKLRPEQERAIEHDALTATWDWGSTLTMQDAPGHAAYVAALLQAAEELDLQGVQVALDCANGAGFRTAPEALRALGATVHAIGVEPDGQNINRGLGAVHPQVLAQHVVDTGSQLGICLDGDADRCILVDHTGRIVDGDGLLWLLRRGPGVVGTVMCNAALPRRLAQVGLDFARAGVGDRQVAMEMQARGWHVGGEPSGHVLLSDGFPTGDGLLTALRVLAGGVDLAERLSDWTLDPQAKINVRVAQKPPLDSLSELASAQEEALQAGISRVLLRYSGTEPKLRILVEAPDQELASAWAQRLAECALAELGG